MSHNTSLKMDKNKEVIFFETPEQLRKWFIKHHENATEFWLGYYKKATKLPSVTWSESVDQALCFGWIDGIRKSIDDKSYKIRFTPRRKKSHWSAVNIKKIAELEKAKLLYPAGITAWEKREASNSKQFAYEQKNVELKKEYLDIIKKNTVAWEYYDNKLAPSYKKISIYWIMSAKQEKTRLRRLNILIESCEEGLKIPMLRKKKK